MVQYSSWSDYLKPNYLGIETETVRHEGKGMEMVKVKPSYHPLPSDETYVLVFSDCVVLLPVCSLLMSQSHKKTAMC